MKRVLSILSVTSVVSLSACLPGPEQLQAGANLEVVVTGLRPAEVVAIDVDTVRFSQTASDDVLRFFVAVPAGRRAGVVSLERDDVRRCVAFVTSAGVVDRVVVGIDVGTAVACDASKPRTLISLEELVVGECSNASCTTLTTFSGTGDVVVDAPGNSGGQGQGQRDDSEALIEEALSSDADDLFATGACAQLGGPPRERVELTRTIDDDGDLAAAVVDISNCRSGIATRLRARLAILRDDVSGD